MFIDSYDVGKLIGISLLFFLLFSILALPLLKWMWS